jgi:L-threonylcarbamoyladenylate synthase
MAAREDVQHAIAQLGAGRPVLLPTDTVYGLCALAASESAVLGLYALKGRQTSQATALLAADVPALLDLLPELPQDAVDVVHALLPGPYTLILPNPARRFRWLSGIRPDSIGVRVPNLPEPAREVVVAAGAVVATSANDPGGPNPASVEAVPQRIRDAAGAILDLGPLPGTPSTVIDFTGPEPFVIREGAVPAAEALSTISEWRSRNRRSSS